MKRFLLWGVLALAPVAVGVPASAQGGSSLMTAPVKWPTIKPLGAGDADSFDTRVAALQYLLRARGVYRGRADGIYGAKTIAAVKAFQHRVGLKADGVAGPKTLPKLVVTVKRGAKGDAVRAAQILVRGAVDHVGGQPNMGLEVDGVFSEQTEKAVKFAQAAAGGADDVLVRDGIMGPRSWCLLLGGEVVYSRE